MLLHSTSSLPFGKYQGISLGLVYLVSPSYINWMLEKTSYCIGDIEFLKSLKVINRFGNQGPIAHWADVDVEELKVNWQGQVDFEDVKFSGFESYSFSSLALSQNEAKILGSPNTAKKRAVVPEADRKIMIFYPGTGKSSDNTTLIPLDGEINKQGRSVLHFEVDNRNGNISFLPHREKLIVSSFFWSEWRITSQEMTEILEDKIPIQGKIVEGQLLLKR